MSVIGLHDILQQFVVAPSALKPSRELAAKIFNELGFSYVPQSYSAVVEYFGESRVCSDSDRFWVCVPEHPSRYYSLKDLTFAFRQKFASWKESVGKPWGLQSAATLPDDLKELTSDQLLPFFCNTEYDHWLCLNWNVTASPREPEVIHFDFGMQKFIYRHSSLTHLLAALVDGRVCEEIIRDEDGKIVTEPFPR